MVDEGVGKSPSFTPVLGGRDSESHSPHCMKFPSYKRVDEWGAKALSITLSVMYNERFSTLKKSLSYRWAYEWVDEWEAKSLNFTPICQGQRLRVPLSSSHEITILQDGLSALCYEKQLLGKWKQCFGVVTIACNVLGNFFGRGFFLQSLWQEAPCRNMITLGSQVFVRRHHLGARLCFGPRVLF